MYCRQYLAEIEDKKSKESYHLDTLTSVNRGANLSIYLTKVRADLDSFRAKKAAADLAERKKMWDFIFLAQLSSSGFNDCYCMLFLVTRQSS